LDKRSTEFIVQPDTGVIVRNANGSVVVRGGASKGLLSAIRRPGPELPHTRFFEPEVDLGQPIVLRCSYSCSRVQASVDLEIDLPRGAKYLEVETINGNIVIAAPGCPVTARTYNGFVRLEGPSGPANLLSRNGAIEMSGDCQVGSISTLNGDVRASVAGVAPDGGSIETTIGSITLVLVPGLGANLDATAGRGSLALSGVDVGSPSVGSGSIRGILGPGGPRLRIRSGVGDLMILRANRQ
jgi:hypothetical protein